MASSEMPVGSRQRDKIDPTLLTKTVRGDYALK